MAETPARPSCTCLPYRAGGSGPERDCPVHGEQEGPSVKVDLEAFRAYWRDRWPNGEDEFDMEWADFVKAENKRCKCFPHGPNDACTCCGCWACTGHELGCTCDIAWDCEHTDKGST